jgi:hypothetical protein
MAVNNITPIKRSGTDPKYICARLARGGYTEELAAIERHETTPHAVAVKLGWFKPRVHIVPTVEGFAQAILAHLTTEQRADLRSKDW